MLDDIAHLVSNRPGVLRRLQSMAEALEHTLVAEIVADFQILYPQEDIDNWDQDEQRQVGKGLELANHQPLVPPPFARLGPNCRCLLAGIKSEIFRSPLPMYVRWIRPSIEGGEALPACWKRDGRCHQASSWREPWSVRESPQIFGPDSG